MIADLKSPINNPASRKQVERAFFVHTRDPIDAGGMLLTPIRGNLSRDVAEGQDMDTCTWW